MRVTHSHRTAERTRPTARRHLSGPAAGTNHRHLQAAPVADQTHASHRMGRRTTASHRTRRLTVRVVVWTALGVVLLGVAAADSAPAAATVMVAQQVTSVSDVFTNIRN